MKTWLALSAVLLVAGCTTTPEERRAMDEQTCRSYGFKKRNDAFAACLQRLDLDRRASARQSQARLDAFEDDFWHHRYYRRPVIVYRPIIKKKP
jgi:hypothetical protein